MRKNGLGTVYQRGQSWVIDYYINGKRIRETVKAARSESQARAKLKERISRSTLTRSSAMKKSLAAQLPAKPGLDNPSRTVLESDTRKLRLWRT